MQQTQHFLRPHRSFLPICLHLSAGRAGFEQMCITAGCLPVAQQKWAKLLAFTCTLAVTPNNFFQGRTRTSILVSLLSLALPLGTIYPAADQCSWKYSPSIIIQPSHRVHSSCPPWQGSTPAQPPSPSICSLNANGLTSKRPSALSTHFTQFMQQAYHLFLGLCFQSVLASFQPVHCTRPSKINIPHHDTANMVRIEAKVLSLSGPAFVTSPMRILCCYQMEPQPPAISQLIHQALSSVQQCLFSTSIPLTIPQQPSCPGKPMMALL